jgi:hypothetical protein
LERGPNNLLTGSGLLVALQFARDNAQELTQEERLYLKKSGEAERKATTLTRRLIGSAVAVIFALSIITGWALSQKMLAEESRDSERLTKNFIARVADSCRFSAASCRRKPKR